MDNKQSARLVLVNSFWDEYLLSNSNSYETKCKMAYLALCFEVLELQVMLLPPNQNHRDTRDKAIAKG